MNKGIRRSTGEYIIFLNAGDTFYDRHTLEIVSSHFGPDLLYGKTVKKDGERSEITSYPELLNKDYFLKYTLSHQSTYYHKNIFQKYGLYDEFYKIAGDYELYSRLVHKGSFTYKYIDKPLSIFYLDGISSCPKNRDRLKYEQHIMRLKYFKSYKKSLKYFKYKIRCLYKAFAWNKA